ncbi:MAG: alpha/beta hydrolase, partial [Actinobacteria bacterium]|nr:alpha/beta hydrolase [Actinomycetota bacterium]
AARSYDRCNCPDGVARQLMAIVVSPDRTEALKEVKIPTLVIHGLLDKFVDPSGGIATADAIPGSKLVTLDEMAHDIPVQLWPAIRDAIIENADRGRSWM